MKTCTQCKEVKSLDDFYKHPRNVDGRESYCKSCKRRRGIARRKSGGVYRFLEKFEHGDMSDRDSAIRIHLKGMGTNNTFWKYVDKQEDCWVWTGNTTTSGYGSFTLHKFGSYLGSVRAHRYSFALHNGWLPRSSIDSLVLDHTCENRACVNPDHLQVVTHAENMAFRKGRHEKAGISLE